MTLPNAKTPKQEPRPLSLVEEKRQQAQHDLDHWSKVAALPELSTKAEEWARNAARFGGGRGEATGARPGMGKAQPAAETRQSKADHQKWLQVAARPWALPGGGGIRDECGKKFRGGSETLREGACLGEAKPRGETRTSKGARTKIGEVRGAPGEADRGAAAQQGKVRRDDRLAARAGSSKITDR
jgi:hypothetical protein